MGWLDLDSYAKTSMDIPSPTVAACTSSQDSGTTSKAAAAGTVTLSRTELDGIVSLVNNLTGSDFNECSLSTMAFNLGGKTPVSQANGVIWYTVAAYVLRTKLLGDYLKADQNSLAISPISSYLIVSNDTTVDAQIRKELSGISEVQLEAATRNLAAKLNANPADGNALYSRLTSAQQSSYNQVCSSDKPSGLRFWGMLYSSPAYPEPISLNISKQEVLDAIKLAKAENPASAGTTGGSNCTTVAGAKQCIDTLGKAYRPQLFSYYYTPYLYACTADPVSAARGRTVTVNLSGTGAGLFTWDANNKPSFINGFGLDFGPGVTATPQLPTLNEFGLFSVLPISIVVDQNAPCSTRTVTIRNGQTVVLDTLENYFRITGCGGEDNDPCKGKTGVFLSACCNLHPESRYCTNQPATPPTVQPPAPPPTEPPAPPPAQGDACTGKEGLMRSACCHNHPEAASCQ